eukprot:CAMPEP_0116957926 /NCGR_PEP_ID=MMETSP0467-20121206/44299_1 /TAXON_ID=283647 /ORGANISM="Mesodinium pulex, Strain SPMC105" /LENGTH=92 /DNA_ID=CAMNT_0004644843 /DNA_START=175 /DNA_END=453 /DNA_ORIENTATION=-
MAFDDLIDYGNEEPAINYTTEDLKLQFKLSNLQNNKSEKNTFKNLDLRTQIETDEFSDEFNESFNVDELEGDDIDEVKGFNKHFKEYRDIEH